MSYVPPSPAKQTTATSSSDGSAWRRRSARCAASTPLATAAAFSNATCSHGTFHAVVGYLVVATSRQPVALTTTVGRSIVLKTTRTTSGTPHPWQSAWPPRNGGTPCWLRTSVFRRDIRHLAR